MCISRLRSPIRVGIAYRRCKRSRVKFALLDVLDPLRQVTRVSKFATKSGDMLGKILGKRLHLKTCGSESAVARCPRPINVHSSQIVDSEASMQISSLLSWPNRLTQSKRYRQSLEPFWTNWSPGPEFIRGAKRRRSVSHILPHLF